MPPQHRPARPGPAHDKVTRDNVDRLFARGLQDLTLAKELALGAREQRHLQLAPEASPGPRQQTLVFDAPQLAPPPPPPRPLIVDHRSGSRRQPYTRGDGVKMIKQSFHATEAFDRLWRRLEGALPTHVPKHVWVEEVLSRAIREQLEHDGQHQAAE